MKSVHFKDCLLYLIGNEQAIRKLARWDKAIFVGGFFVLIAGICREYDQELFFLNPAIYFVPFIASFIMCLLIRGFCHIYFVKANNSAGLGSFWTFLSLFWLTAPCAWFYALPVEYYFNSFTALKINLWLLGLVSVWRVWLFTRVLKILTGVNILASILAVAAPVIVVSSFFFHLNLVGVMSGGNFTEEQQFLININSLIGELAVYLVIPFFAIYFIHSSRVKSFTSFEKTQKFILPKNFLVTCALILISSITMMIKPQLQLEKLVIFKSLVNNEHYMEALEFAEKFEEVEFPVTRKIYPSLQYYGFNDAITLFSKMDGSEKEWIRKGVEKWVSRGLALKRIYSEDFIETLSIVPIREYQKNFLSQYKDDITRHVKMDSEKKLPLITEWLKVLEIELEVEPEIEPEVQ